jgi:hypothetical protein
VINALVK